MDDGDAGGYSASRSKIERHYVNRCTCAFDAPAVNFVKHDGKGSGMTEPSEGPLSHLWFRAEVRGLRLARAQLARQGHRQNEGPEG